MRFFFFCLFSLLLLLLLLFCVYLQKELDMNERVPLAIDLTFDITIPFSMIETDCRKNRVLLTFSSNALVCTAMRFLSFIHHIEITPKHIAPSFSS